MRGHLTIQLFACAVTSWSENDHSIRSDLCSDWCHRKCANLSVDNIARYSHKKTPGYSGCHSSSFELQFKILKAKVFGRYLDDIFRFVKARVIENSTCRANNLHPCLNLTSEIYFSRHDGEAQKWQTHNGLVPKAHRHRSHVVLPCLFAEAVQAEQINGTSLVIKRPAFIVFRMH